MPTDNRPDCDKNSIDYLHECQLDVNNIDPFYYEQFFNLEDDDPSYDIKQIDDMLFEYFGIHGNKTDIYLVTKYNPNPFFGEDPNQAWELPPIQAKGIFTPTNETMTYGEFGRNTQSEELLIEFHKSTIKNAIKEQLLEYGLIEDLDSLDDDLSRDKFERHRLNLQEGDVIRMYYNNIHYIIDGIKEEPDYQPLLKKFIYSCTCRPILVSGENIGSIQPTTKQDAIVEENNLEVDTEANKIIF